MLSKRWSSSARYSKTSQPNITVEKQSKAVEEVDFREEIVDSLLLRLVSSVIDSIRSFLQYLTSISSKFSWSKGVNVIPKDCSADFSNVVMSNGQGYIQGKIPCCVCGKTRGMKRRCSHADCRARGEKKQAYHFHISCARQAGYEVNHDDDSDEQEEFYGKYDLV